MKDSSSKGGHRKAAKKNTRDQEKCVPVEKKKKTYERSNFRDYDHHLLLNQSTKDHERGQRWGTQGGSLLRTSEEEELGQKHQRSKGGGDNWLSDGERPDEAVVTRIRMRRKRESYATTVTSTFRRGD